jgi:plasmid stabilization system protein ParE
MRVLWSPAADGDLIALWAYLAQQATPKQADAQIARIRDVSRRLSEWPESGRPRDKRFQV